MFRKSTPLRVYWVKGLWARLIGRDAFSFLEKSREVLGRRINASFYKHSKGYAPYLFR